MNKWMEMLLSRKFWLTIVGTVGIAWMPYLEGVLSLKEALIMTGTALVNYIWQLGKTDTAKIGAGATIAAGGK